MQFNLVSWLLLLSTAVALSSTAVESSYSTGKCTPGKVQTRKEWRHLTTEQKNDYIQAEKCLFNRPSQLDLSGTTVRFEDLQAIHQVQTYTIHHVAQFLPWHRYFLHAHETLLRTECNYTGPMVWWNVNRDAGRFLLSEIFDPVTGFGGNGTGPDGCVTDGPFANTTMHIGPFQEITTYCLWRSFNEAASLWANSSAVKECNSKDNYYDMWKCVDNQTGGLHGSGHVGTGGTVADPDASPGDPLFYLHHGWIDRLWWAWQSQDPTNRLYQLGGYTTQSEPEFGWVNTTLDYTLYSYNILPNVTVGQVMNTEGGYLCYNYD